MLAILGLALPAAASAAPAGSTVLVSRPDGTGPVPPAFDNNSQTPGAISADDRYVVFTSYADGFAPGTFPGAVNVLLRDRVTKTTTLVSRSDGVNGAGADRDSGAPAIAVAPAGMMPTAPHDQPHVLVTFATEATNLVDHDTGQSPPPGSPQVWMRDVTAGTTTLISRKSGSTLVPGNAGGADLDQASPVEITPGGPVVAFFAASSNLDGGAGGIFLRTVLASATEPVSCQNGNCMVANPSNAPGFDPSMRVRGSTIQIAFDSNDKNLTGDAAGHSQVMLALAPVPTSSGQATPEPNLILPVSEASLTPGNGDSTRPSFNGDGHDVAFLSQATNLTGDTLPTSHPQEAFVHSLDDGSNTLVSRAGGASGDIADKRVFTVSLGGDSTHLRAVFDTSATNLGTSTTHGQAYVRDLPTDTTSVLNRASGASGALGENDSSDPDIAPDGSAAIFSTRSGNLGDGSGDRFERVQLRTLPSADVASGTDELISRPGGSAPFQSLTDNSGFNDGNMVSTNGRYVVFGSQSLSLNPGANPNATFIYVRDLLMNRTIMVSRASGANGAIANGDSAEPGGISADGRFVEFDSNATNLSPLATNGKWQVYIRDLVTNTTALVSRSSGASGAPSADDAFAAGISADGKVALIQAASPLDPAGAVGSFHLYARVLAANTTTLVDRENGAGGAVAAQDVDRWAIDADGNRIAWSTTAPLAGAPADGFEHVYVRDVRAGTTTLVSRSDGATGASAAGESRDVSIDAAGNVVAFSSDAQNLGRTFVNFQVFVRDLRTSHTELVSHVPTAVGDLASSAEEPSLDAAGDRVAFVAYGTLAGSHFEVFVRDLRSQTTDLASRANGANGAPADGDSGPLSLDPTGNCVAFQTSSTNLGDGFGSADFSSVHLRVLRGQCPLPVPVPSLSKLRIEPHRVHLHGRHRGATITFTVSVAAKVMLRFDQLRSGRRLGHRCVVGRRHGKRCTVVKRRRSVSVSAKHGPNRLRFSAKGLPVGRYRLTATPLGGKLRTITFTIVR
jgi:Tol biopolymer transport system component